METTGTATVSAVPDLVVLRLAVQVSDEHVDGALRRAGALMGAVHAALRDAGVPGQRLRTDGVGVHPGYDGSGQPRGYQSTQGVSVVLAPDDQVEAALTAALAVAGDALAVLGLEQALVDPLALAPSARARAVEGARVKATHFADLVGARLGPVRWELEHP